MPEGLNLNDSYVLLHLGRTAYAIPSQVIQQIEMVEAVTPLPNAPAFVEGVVFSRGQMIPAINLRARFGFEKIAFDVKTRLLVIRSEERTVGLIVDSAREFVRLPLTSIQPPPETISGLSGEYLKGIAKLGERLILVLKIDDLLDSVAKISIAPTVALEA